MADSASSSDYKLDNLTVTAKDAADDLGKLAVEKTTFGALKSDQVFSQPPALSGSDELAVGGIKLGISASATYQATAFVRSTDTDPDGVVTVGANQAWLKAELALVADLSGNSGSRKLGSASAKAEGSTKTDVRLLDYRLHSPNDLVAQAVVDAIQSARFAVRVADVDQLDSGSRLAVVESGDLSLTLKLSVADTLSASLMAIVKAASQQDPRWTASWGWALATALPPISELSLRGSVAGRQQTYLQSAQDLLEKQGQAMEVVTAPRYTAQEKPELEPIDLAGLGGRSPGSRSPSRRSACARSGVRTAPRAIPPRFSTPPAKPSRRSPRGAAIAHRSRA
jgi:hypothetical protein